MHTAVTMGERKSILMARTMVCLMGWVGESSEESFGAVCWVAGLFSETGGLSFEENDGVGLAHHDEG